MPSQALKVLVFYGGESGTNPRNELLAWLRGPRVSLDAQLVAEAPPHSKGSVDDRVDAAIEWADKAIAILTPDGRTPQGAPNVIDEIGRWRGRKGKDSLCILRQSGVEPYSNHAGIVYVSFKERVSECYEGLRQFLNENHRVSSENAPPEQPVAPSPKQLSTGNEDSFVTPEAHLFRRRWRLRQNPFLFYSAENLGDSDILRLFVADPASSLAAFSFNVNNIIRGTYGCGKTMCLRAVEAFAVSQLIVDLLDNRRTAVLPVRINVSDIAHLTDSDHIYSAIIHSVFQALAALGRRIQKYVSDGGWFTSFGDWRTALSKSGIFARDARYEHSNGADLEERARRSLSDSSNSLSRLVQDLLDAGRRENYLAVADINKFHSEKLNGYCERVLLLIDEVGSLAPAFFVTKGPAPSSYEVLMNQLRTSQHVYYKLCVYPGHYSDTLQESRYGTRISLDYSVRDTQALRRYQAICRDVLSRYIRSVQYEGDTRNLTDFIREAPEDHVANAAYDCPAGGGSALEQLCIGSQGGMRRLFTLAGKAMVTAAGHFSPLVDRSVVFDQLAAFGGELLERHTTSEHNQITAITEVCRQARTYLFSSEIETQSLLKPFLSKTQQDSVLSLSEHTTGRLVYEFDYAYCVAYGLETHVHDSRENCNARTLAHATWTNEVADVTEAVLRLSGLTRGVVAKYFIDKGYGFIIYDSNEEEVFFHVNDVIDWGGLSDVDIRNRRVRFALGDSPKGKKARSVVIEPDEHSGRIRFR